MRYRRARTQGGTYFFTVVTHKRKPFLCEPENISLLRTLFREIKDRHPFTINAAVILPDHIHCLWTLPRGDHDFSKRWRLIKSGFSRRCRAVYKGTVTQSRQRKREAAVWQRRFWEHEIRNEKDYLQHVEYIHYNPVKHGLVTAPADWPYSSFRHHVSRGLYEPDWGAGKKIEFAQTIGKE